jgi:hypothetical protein
MGILSALIVATIIGGASRLLQPASQPSPNDESARDPVAPGELARVAGQTVTPGSLNDKAEEKTGESFRPDAKRALQEADTHKAPEASTVVENTGTGAPRREEKLDIALSGEVEQIDTVPAPHLPLIREVMTQEFIFKLSGCAISGANVKCDLLVTDLVGDRDFKIDSGQIADANGNVYAATRFYLGTESGPFHVHSPLPAGLAIKASLDFKSVRPGVSVLEMLELKGHTMDRARSQVVVRFLKIAL